jgi:hypothetical protein
MLPPATPFANTNSALFAFPSPAACMTAPALSTNLLGASPGLNVNNAHTYTHAHTSVFATPTPKPPGVNNLRLLGATPDTNADYGSKRRTSL